MKGNNFVGFPFKTMLHLKEVLQEMLEGGVLHSVCHHPSILGGTLNNLLLYIRPNFIYVLLLSVSGIKLNVFFISVGLPNGWHYDSCRHNNSYLDCFL